MPGTKSQADRKTAGAVKRAVRLVLAAGLIGGAALSLGACAAISPKEAVPFYDLDAPSEFAGARGHSRAQILIPVPSAVKALDTDAIAVKSDAKVITYLAGGQWSDRLPVLLQARIIEAFENSGRVKAIGRPGEGLLINYQISTNVRAFELDVDGQSQGVVEIAAKIIDDRNGRVVATRTFRAASPTSRDNVDAAVKGINQALSVVLVDLVEWVIGRI